MTDPFARLGLAMARAKWVVLVAWLVVVGVSAGLLAPRATEVVKGGGFVIGGSESAKAAEILESDFNASTRSNVVVVFHDPNADVLDPAFRTEVEAGLERLAAVEGVLSVFSYYTTGQPQLVSEDRHTTIALVALGGDEEKVQEEVGELRESLEGVSGVEHYVTGLPAINYDTEVTSESDLRRSELFTIPIVLILLLLVFRTVISAVIPLILGGFGVVTTLGLLYPIGSVTDTSIFALNVASMIGLGLGIDFSLIVISRYREEREAGYAVQEAIARTMATAGRSITYSGVTVVLAMAVLTIMLYDIMIVRSISLAVMLVAAVAILAGLTLLPAILAILQHRLEWLPVLPRRKKRETAAETEQGFWYRLSHTIMRRPGIWLAASLVVLALLASPIRDLAMVGASTGVLPEDVESVQGAELMNEAFGANELNPIQIVLTSDEPGGVWNPEFLSGLSQLTDQLQHDRRAHEVNSLRSSLPLVSEEHFVALTPDYFTPAPVMEDPTDLTAIELEGVEFETVIYAEVPQVPPDPAFVGLGRFTLEPGTVIPETIAPAFYVLRLESGALTVTAGTETTLTGVSTGGQPALAPIGQPFVVQAGEQLVIPSNTPITVESDPSQPTVFLSVTVFVIRSSTAPQDAWTEGSPALDLFAGQPRQVLAGGVSNFLPEGPAAIVVDRAVAQPGAFFPKHIHPGPELIAVEEGEFTIFAAPPREMTMTGEDGRVEEGPFDTPITLGPGAKALVQGYRIHRGQNLGNVPTTFYSTRVYDSAESPFTLIGPTEIASQFVNLGGDNNAAVISIVANRGQYEDEHQQLVYDLREEIIPSIPELAGYEVYVGGDAAGFVDFRDRLYGRFPLIALVVMALIFVILMMFFQSVFLPLKAIFMNLVSILATYGILVLIFQKGYGTGLMGFESQGLLNVITPAILFVILFALSTDYEVFMLSRVKEYYHQTGNNDEAVAAGLQHTAGVITAAGLILIGTFGSFATAQVVTIKEIGLGLAIGVLIDSTIVRVVMVPATMKLAGDLNWWMPDWLKKIVPELREGPAPELGPAPVPGGVGLGAPAMAAAGAGAPSSFNPSDFSPVNPPASSGSVPAPTQRVAQLRPSNGSLGVDVIPLSPTRPLTIGRDAGNALQFFDARISRQHARIENRGGRYVVIDLGSSNGVYVNGQRIAAQPEMTTLRVGDLVEIGNFGIVAFAYEER
jgi:uncharacterized membrane protein YdfJ with MMPL/SSD domain